LTKKLATTAPMTLRTINQRKIRPRGLFFLGWKRGPALRRGAGRAGRAGTVRTLVETFLFMAVSSSRQGEWTNRLASSINF
jgi:hypothetical protein